jgi:hypothetical protein
MTNRTVAPRATRLAVLIATLAVLLSAVPVHAASSVRIEANALVGGRYEVGGWLALSVTLVNDGAPTDGYLSAPSTTGTMRHLVEMPAGARKVVTLYIEPEAFAREVTVTYTEPNGAVTATVEVQVFEQAADQVAVVGDTTGSLRPQLLGMSGTSAPEPLPLSVADIPERTEPLDGIAAIVWASDSGTLAEGQRRALERWVVAGGQLVVIGGPDWQARTAAFGDLLPLTDLDAVDDVDLGALAGWAGGDPSALDGATVSTGTPRADGHAIVRSGDTILASFRPLGAGRVVYLGVDLATESFRTWDGSPAMWGRILPANAFLEQFLGGFPMREQMDSSMVRALQTLPTLNVPPVELLLGVIVGYILLIGPVSYLVLRRIDRRELAWVTAPILVIAFSACSYGIGRSMKGSDVVVNQVSVVRTSPAGTATVQTYAGIFSPDRATYDVTVAGDALLARLDPTIDGIREDTGGGSASGIVVDQGDPAHLRGLGIGVFGFQAVSADGLVDHAPSLTLSWRSDGDDMIGTVTNVSDHEMTDVAYVGPSGGERIGTLAPGASGEFTAPRSNFNGSSASDQVYGFGGFANGTDDQRRITLRRNVIDGLVGYAGFPGSEFFGGGDLGPFVIGWTEDEGPMPASVDGVQARRYLSTVEVLTAAAPLGIGQVTIRPHQMAVNVIATDGDVGSVERGFVTIIDGSATFSVALPLEASGLAATSLEVVIAPDAQSLVTDPGSFAGFWPPGYTVEVRNPRTGEWTELGDLNEANRFTIDDPADALTPEGRMEVRVSGSVDPNFGQQSIFVGAVVEGVLGE